MELVLDILSWACILAGSFFSIVGGIGLLRLPDFYCRIHGGGITDTAGAGLLLLGMTLQADAGLTAIKLLMILFFLIVTSPTSTHALAKSALTHGYEPPVEQEGEPPSNR